MQKIKLLKTFWLTFFTLLVTVSYAQTWELKKQKNGISIYTRSYKNSKFKEYKAVMVANTTLEKAYKTILDGNNLWRWSYKTERSEVLAKLSDSSYVFYIKNNLPWPVLNRDHLSLVTVEEKTPKRIKITLQPYNTLPIPKQPNTIRITNFNGVWLLEQKPYGIKVTQQLFGDPEGNLPAWFLNSLLTTSPYQSFIKLRALLEQ